MIFEDALKAMREGKKITNRQDIDNGYYYYLKNDGIIKGHKNNKHTSVDTMQFTRCFFEEWQIYEEQKQLPSEGACYCYCNTCICPTESKYFGISEAIKRMKSGKRVSIKCWNNPKIYLMVCPLESYKGIETIKGIWVKTGKGKLGSWTPNDSELMSEEYYEVDGE